MLKIIIAGSRSFNDYELLKTYCLSCIKSLYDDKCLIGISKKDIEIISGGANGADKLGEKFARELGLRVKIFPADWQKFGKSAGPIRNGLMAKYASYHGDIGVLIAFRKNASAGTTHMIESAQKRDMKVFIKEI